jgi:hypothetical protein
LDGGEMRSSIAAAVLLQMIILTTNANCQYINIPSELYEPDVLIIWFQDNVVNKDYLGCDSDFDATGEIPFNPTVIQNPQVYSALDAFNVVSMRKVVSNFSPCTDTISISKRGDEVVVPEVWNILKIEFDLTGSEYDIPNIAYLFTMIYHPSIHLAEPNYIFTYEEPDPGSDSIAYLNGLSK